MLYEKPKNKNAPKKYRCLYQAILVFLCGLAIGFFALPYAETALNQWLADDPFTPMCAVDHLEVAFMSNARGDAQLYRVHANGESPQAVTELLDPKATTFQWTPDGQYLIFSMPNTTPGKLHFVHADNGEITSMDLPDWQFNWYVMPDSSAIIVWMRYSDKMPDAKFRIDLPLQVDTQPQSIASLPQELYWRDFHVYGFVPSTKIGSMQSRFYPEASQVKFSPDNTYVVTTQKYIQRAGVNLGKDIIIIIIRQTATDEIVWQIGETVDGFDVEYIVADMTPSNKIIYYRQYFPIGDNTIAPDMPLDIFIADIETQHIEPILVDRPLKDVRDILWLPDGETLFSALENWDTRTIDVYIGDIDWEDQRLVTSIPFGNYSAGGFKITPEGQYLSYVDRKNDWMYLLDWQTHDRCRVVKGRTDDWSTSFQWRLAENEKETR